VGNRADDFQLHRLLGQQPQRPARLALRGRAASQGNEPRFLRPIKGPLIATGTRLGQQRGRQALLDKALAYALDRAGAEVQRLGGLLIATAGTGLGLVDLQQHAGVCQFAGIGLSFPNQTCEFVSFFAAQGHTVLLRHVLLPGS